MNVVRLVKKAKRGNKEALLQLIMLEQDVYFRLAMTYMGNTHDAMDVMDDMIVKVYEKIHQLHSEEAFYSWSKTILVNSCKSLLHKQKRIVLVEDFQAIETIEIAESLTRTSDPYSNRDQHMDIQALLLHISDHQKEAIQLKYLHDLNYQTIAAITQVSIGTVKSRVSEGLKKLRLFARGDEHE
ncbi:RNA polymerase sigma-70 factor (ECF subfamily) [Paenibacillus shirakamiensis]|uniref:RNA polymerase sigma-70 factor (ECF subfamily) n=1 Tax=Paenibacillus shirakamiensis TaxID=1265935 RepID=A0ABS4JD59_9BACL|nr:sigma-70 family RNA polymerase sigma factor [Paenibacillus shirakamiensis]MBP1999655.1 RNA polymerase sigma-70 factor (ECF subfamily) [Paenibacillus shirakamiensis]